MVVWVGAARRGRLKRLMAFQPRAVARVAAHEALNVCSEDAEKELSRCMALATEPTVLHARCSAGRAAKSWRERVIAAQMSRIELRHELLPRRCHPSRCNRGRAAMHCCAAR